MKKKKLVFTPGVTCVICLHVFVNMLYRDAARDLSCHLWNTLEGTSHNRDEEPSGIQVPDCLLQTLLKKKKLLENAKNENASKSNGKFPQIKVNPQDIVEIVCFVCW